MKEDGSSKQDLERESTNSKESRKSLRGCSETSISSHILPKVCIFCWKVSKYKKGKTREKLMESCELRADKTVKAAAHQKCDQRMLSITSKGLHASEAMYRISCYMHIVQAKERTEEAGDECSPFNLALNNVKNCHITI